MSQKANHFKIGLFVLAGTALMVAAIIVLGAGALKDKGVVVETYMDETVQGLDVGSPVKYRGVQVGNVREIGFVADHYPGSKGEFNRYILVRATIQKEMLHERSGAEPLAERLEKQIDLGMRVRLASQGLTGLAYLEVDYTDPTRAKPLPIDWEPEVQYVPSAPSRFTVIGESLERVAVGLQDANLPEIATNIKELIATVKGTVAGLDLDNLVDESTKLMTEARQTNKGVQDFILSAEMKKLSSDAAATAASARKLVDDSHSDVRETIETIRQSADQLRDVTSKARELLQSEEFKRSVGNFEQTTANARAASDKFPETVDSMNRTLRRMDNLLSSQQNDLRIIVENLRQVSANLRDLSEETRRYPSNTLFGKGPRPSEVNK